MCSPVFAANGVVKTAIQVRPWCHDNDSVHHDHSCELSQGHPLSFYHFVWCPFFHCLQTAAQAIHFYPHGKKGAWEVESLAERGRKKPEEERTMRSGAGMGLLS